MRPVLFTFLISSQLLAAFEITASDPLQGGTAASSVATDQIYSAFLLNPAVTAGLSRLNFGLSYFQPYGISGLYYAGIVANGRFRNLGSGIAMSTFGDELYRESQVLVNVSCNLLKDRFMLGMNLRGYHIAVHNYESMTTVGIDAGVQYRIHPAVLMGFSVINMNEPALGGRREELPLITQWGMSYQMGEDLTTYIAISKDAWFPISLRFGFHFRVNTLLSLQSGFNTGSSVPAIGIDLRRNWISLHYAFQYHFDLGGSHWWGMSFDK